MTKKSTPSMSFLTWTKRVGDKVQFLQTTDLHFLILSLLFGALSSLMLGATFVAIGAYHTFIPLIGNEIMSKKITFFAGFAIMFLLQYTITTLVQAAGEQVAVPSRKNAILFGLIKLENFNMPQIFAILLSILAIIIAFTGVYHLQEVVNNSKLMLFLFLFSITGEVSLIFIVNVRMYLKNARISSNYIVQQIEKEDKLAYEVATNENIVANPLLNNSNHTAINSLVGGIAKPTQAKVKIDLPDLTKYINEDE
jgi:hypothetical protein